MNSSAAHTRKPINHVRPCKDCDSGSVSTYLVIPYYDGDRGLPGIDRPLDGTAPSWLCPSIKVNGQAGGRYRRGESTTVTVDVANHGAGVFVAPVTVSVWWADPTTGFVAPHPFGQVTMSVPTGGEVRESPPITGVIPSSAPAHVCLLVRVTSPFDAPAHGEPANPGQGRHWAQMNLTEVSIEEGGIFRQRLTIGNSGRRLVRIRIHARQAGPEVRRAIAHITQQATGLPRRADVQLSWTRSEHEAQLLGRRHAQAAFVETPMGPYESREVEVVGRIEGLSPGDPPVVIELVQTAVHDKGEETVMGAIGVLITASRHDQ